MGRIEELLEEKHQIEAISQKQKIVGIHVVRITGGKFVKELLTAKELERIESLTEDNNY